jgi:hypothetical protein
VERGAVERYVQATERTSEGHRLSSPH